MSKVDFSQIEDVGNKHQITSKNRAGRPEKEIKREKRVVVYLTDDEYKKIEEYAVSKNKTVSQYVREELCGVRNRFA